MKQINDWKDIYKLPLKDSHVDLEHNWRSGRINDAKGNFVFQFSKVTQDSQQKLLDIINGVDRKLEKECFFIYDKGDIVENLSSRKVIKIRGWGNLTGSGGHNLSGEDGAKVQDTFADYIVERLNSSNRLP